jgi:phosphate uptake regulator
MLSTVSKENEVRKIQFTGRSTYILSLPKKWMNEMHLKPGDPVTIIREANNSLTILPNTRSPISNDEVITLILHDETGNSLKRKIVSMYLAGYKFLGIT